MNILKNENFEIIKREFTKDKKSLVALITFVSLVVIIFVSSLFLDQEKIMTVSILDSYARPGEGFWLGADSGGRSILGQLIIGARNSLIIAFCVTAISSTIGITVGLITGYYGGIIDTIIMRIIDFISILPTTMIIIVFVTIVPKYNVFYFILILTVFSWMGTTRMIRSKTLSESNKEYIMASKSMGTSDFKIILRELLPNVMSIVVVNVTLSTAANIGVETGLSYLGYGFPISTPSLGTLVSYSSKPEIISSKPWIWLPAVLLILVLILSINYIGETIKRITDAKQRLG